MAGTKSKTRPPLPLPLSTWTYNTLPDHALVHSIITSRVVATESALLLSRPSQWLLNYISPNSVVLLASSAGLALSIRLRHQWRALLSVVGTLEGISNTVALIQNTHDDSEEVSDTVQLRRTLYFWLVYVALSFFEDARVEKGFSSSLPYQLRRWAFAISLIIERTFRRARIASHSLFELDLPTFQASVRSAVLHPSLDLSQVQNSLKNMVLLFQKVIPDRKRSFPEPLPFTGSTRQEALEPLYLTYFSTEVHYRIFKVLLLWISLRRTFSLSPKRTVASERRTKYTLLLNGATGLCERVPQSYPATHQEHSALDTQYDPDPSSSPLPQDDDDALTEYSDSSDRRLSSDSSLTSEAGQDMPDTTLVKKLWSTESPALRPDTWSLGTPIKFRLDDHWTGAASTPV